MAIVLAVDDDIDDLELLEEAIRTIAPNAILLKAHNGKEALTILDDIVPDYIFLDINMPIMNGLDCLELIRQNRNLKRTPIAVISTSTSTGDKLLSSRFNAGYIQKPNTFQELLRVVNTFFKTYSNT